MKYLLEGIVVLLSLNIIEGAFRCDYEFRPNAKGWFKTFKVPATWFDARLRCALEGAILASPRTPALKSEIMDIINSTLLESEFFTGIHSTFSQGDYYTVNGVPLSDIPATWAENEPNNEENNESCLTINVDGNLADRNCMDVRPYICARPYSKEKEVNECGTIDPEYFLDKRTGSCYKFHTVPRLQRRAFFACSAEGGHLAIINDETEAQVIREIFGRFSGSTIIGHSINKDLAYIGFHDWSEHGEWRTIYGQTLSEAGYSKFSGGEPNNGTSGGEFCGGVHRNGLLCDIWCDNSLAFICEKKPKIPRVCHVPQSVEDSERNCWSCVDEDF